MSLFDRRAREVHGACDMCGKSESEGCGGTHTHVVEIGTDAPSWLPGAYRALTRGQYTWFCTRCNSFPAMKWPSAGDAIAGMALHLASAHRIGGPGAAAPLPMVHADE